jgi:hypothetical protein
LPTNPGRMVSGTLKFDPSEGGYLHLIGSFKDITALNETLRADIIQGVGINGKLVTLYNCTEIKTHLSRPGFLSNTFFAEMIFIGVNFETVERIQFKTMVVGLSYLDEWIDTSGFSKIKREPKGYVIEYKLPELIGAEIAGNVHITIDTHTNLKANRLTSAGLPKDSTLSQKNYVIIKPSEEKTIQWYLEIIRQLANFFSMGVRQPVHILSLDATSESNTKRISGGNIVHPKIEIFFSVANSPTKLTKVSISDMLFTYNEIVNWLPTIFVKWFENADQLKPVQDLYFGSLYNTSMYLYNAFLNFVQALESYHRRLFPNVTELSPAEHQLQLEEITNSIPEKYRDWLSKQLKYSNEINLRKRLVDLFNRYTVIPKLFENDSKLESFIYKVGVTRNYLTHYDPSLREQAASGEALRMLVDKLKIILDVCFLVLIDFSSDDTEILMRRNDMYSDEFKR